MCGQQKKAQLLAPQNVSPPLFFVTCLFQKGFHLSSVPRSLMYLPYDLAQQENKAWSIPQANCENTSPRGVQIFLSPLQTYSPLIFEGGHFEKGST